MPVDKKEKSKDELDGDLILDDNITDGVEDEDENGDGGETFDLDVGDDLDEEGDDDDEGRDGSKNSKSNHKFAEMRTENTDLKKTVDDLRRQVDNLGTGSVVDPVVPTVPATDPNDPRKWSEAQWDQLAKDDWKRAVDLRSEIKAQDLLQSSSTKDHFEKGQEEAKVSVLKRHPELNDGNSEKAKIYRNIVTANPDYVNQKKGPLIAMYEMEEYMERTMGYKRDDIVKAEKRGAEGEADRQHRVSLSSTKGRSTSATANKIKLSRDELEFCKINSLNPKDFATNKRKLETAGKGGIQL